MLFNSYIFIFLFLPIVLIGWFGLNKIKKYKIAEIFLVGMSLWFYAYFNFSYFFIIVGSCIFNFFYSMLVEKVEKYEFSKVNFDNSINHMEDEYNYYPQIESKAIKLKKKILGITALAVNIGVLFYYKYFDFFISNINSIFKTDFNLLNILLPLGISFFTFQQLSYVVDRMKGEAPHYDLIEYLSFVTFFPQLIAGPIVLHSELIPQFRDIDKRKFNIENFTDGCVQAILGLGKKVLLADTLALVVNNAYNNRYYFTTWSVILFTLTFAFEIYFDFSGYCDIAMGIGKMFNYDIPRNFNYPYLATSMKEFWNRWHITLSRFFITYLYIPMGGGKKGKLRKSINTMIVFLLSGLWHGANWNYVWWGFLNGIGVIYNNTRKKHIKNKFLSWLLTYTYFLFTLIFFRSESMEDVKIILKGLCNPFGIKFVYDMANYMDIPELYIFKQATEMFAPGLTGYIYLIAFIIIMIISGILIRGKNAETIVKERNYTFKTAIFLSIIFMWSVISLSGVSTFLYFNF